MTIQSVLKMGNAQLAQPALPVIDFTDLNLKHSIQDLIDTMHAQAGVGIAAPQIGLNRRIIIFGYDSNPRYPNEKPVPFTVLINPTIKILSKKMIDGWEGCLSVPGLRGIVSRYEKIQYQGFDLSGQLITRVAEGFHARMVQHEYDHIEGVLFPQRMNDLKNFGFEDELKDIIWPKQHNI